MTCTTAPQNSISDKIDHFPIARLPYELRQLVYTFYHHSLPPITITKSNTKSPLHQHTNLGLSSPFFAADVSPTLFYQNAVFEFLHGEDMKSFSLHYERGRDVREIEVVYGGGGYFTDWVYLLQSCFHGLEEIIFGVERDLGGKVEISEARGFGPWWGCVRDAVREGLRGRGDVVLRVEDGEWSVCEWAGG
jgi:hypothetical protein